MLKLPNTKVAAEELLNIRGIVILKIPHSLPICVMLLCDDV